MCKGENIFRSNSSILLFKEKKLCKFQFQYPASCYIEMLIESDKRSKEPFCPRADFSLFGAFNLQEPISLYLM